MPNYNSTLQSNNTDLQAILDTINELPSAGGSDPVLQDKTITPSTSKQTVTADSGYGGLDTVTVNAIPSQYITTTDATAAASEIFSGETAYVNGSKVTGTFSIDSELSTQDDLISQIQAAVDSLPEAGSGSEDLDTELTTQESLITELSTILDSKASGGSGGGVEYEIVTITESSNTIPFTLARVTNTFGLYNSTTPGGGATQICGHIDTLRLVIVNQGFIKCHLADGSLFLEGQALTAGINFAAPYTAVFINDPSKEAIYG
jgi:hypothetical protein